MCEALDSLDSLDSLNGHDSLDRPSVTKPSTNVFRCLDV